MTKKTNLFHTITLITSSVFASGVIGTPSEIGMAYLGRISNPSSLALANLEAAPQGGALSGAYSPTYTLQKVDSKKQIAIQADLYTEHMNYAALAFNTRIDSLFHFYSSFDIARSEAFFGRDEKGELLGEESYSTHFTLRSGVGYEYSKNINLAGNLTYSQWVVKNQNHNSFVGVGADLYAAFKIDALNHINLSLRNLGSSWGEDLEDKYEPTLWNTRAHAEYSHRLTSLPAMRWINGVSFYSFTNPTFASAFDITLNQYFHLLMGTELPKDFFTDGYFAIVDGEEFNDLSFDTAPLASAGLVLNTSSINVELSYQMLYQQDHRIRMGVGTNF
jgi:hypothetical protein